MPQQLMKYAERIGNTPSAAPGAVRGTAAKGTPLPRRRTDLSYSYSRGPCGCPRRGNDGNSPAGV